jgi:UDP-glucose 4-epimerase
VFNVCTGRATSILRLAETLGELTGWAPAITFAPERPGDIRSSLGSPSAARLALRAPPPIDLTAGLSALLASLKRPVRVTRAARRASARAAE